MGGGEDWPGCGVLLFGFDGRRQWKNTSCGEDVLKNWLDTYSLMQLCTAFLLICLQRKWWVPMKNVMCPAALTGRHRCRMINREEEIELEHEEKVAVAETMLGVAAKHVDERKGDICGDKTPGRR